MTQKKTSNHATTNREYSKTQQFESLCTLAGIEPTKRQASKFRRGYGTAYAKQRELQSSK